MRDQQPRLHGLVMAMVGAGSKIPRTGSGCAGLTASAPQLLAVRRAQALAAEHDLAYEIVLLLANHLAQSHIARRGAAVDLGMGDETLLDASTLSASSP